METYQNRLSPLYNNLPFMEIEGEVIPYPCVAEVKFDGEFQYLVKNKDNTYLLNKPCYGRVRTGMTVTSVNYPEDSIFTAELVYGAGKNFYDFERHKTTDDLNLIIFGCLRYQGIDIWKTNIYLDTRLLLESQKFYNDRVKLVPRFIAHNRQELDNYYKTVCDLGFEGIVIKDPASKIINGKTAKWVKWKHECEGDFAIIGFQTGTARAKTLSVILGHLDNGKIVPISRCGGGFTINEKDTLLKDLQSKVIGKVGDDCMVKPEIIIKVIYNGAVKDANGVVTSLRHPRFDRFRPDKTINEIESIK
jgi:ATP-dependent DNA ligase